MVEFGTPDDPHEEPWSVPGFSPDVEASALPYDDPFGPPDEAFLRPADDAEAVGDVPASLEHLRAYCAGWVDFTLAQDREERRAGKGRTYTDEQISLLLADEVETTAGAGDIAAADASITEICSLADGSDAALAAACFAGMAAGSEHAGQALREVLDAERNAARDSARQRRADRPYMLRPSVAVPLLRDVMAECRRRQLPADMWITTYAYDDEQRWHLLFDDSRKRAEAGPQADDPYSRLYGEKSRALITELLDADRFEPEFICYEMSYLMDTVRDSVLRSALVDRFRVAVEDLPQVLWRPPLSTFARVGVKVVRDPQLATDERIGYFDHTISEWALRLEEAGIERFDLAAAQFAWRLAMARHRGAGAKELVELLDLLVSEILVSGIPDAPDGTALGERGDRGRGTWVRNNMLGMYAEQAAEQGDFATVREFLSAMSPGARKESCIMCVLPYAATAGEVALISPDAVELSLEPGLRIPFSLAEARVRGDAAAINAIARRAIGSLANPDAHAAAAGHITAAYDMLAVQDPAAARVIARDALAVYREAGGHAAGLTYLSEALITAGDPHELGMALEYLAQNPYDAQDWIPGLRRLRSLLDGIEAKQ